MRTFVEWIWDSIPHELQRKGDIESYEKVKGRYPNYSKIWYNLSLGSKQRVKNISKD